MAERGPHIEFARDRPVGGDAPRGALEQQGDDMFSQTFVSKIIAGQVLPRCQQSLAQRGF